MRTAGLAWVSSPAVSRDPTSLASGNSVRIEMGSGVRLDDAAAGSADAAKLVAARGTIRCCPSGRRTTRESGRRGARPAISGKVLPANG